MKTLMKLLRKLSLADIALIVMIIVAIFVDAYTNTKKSYRMSDVQNAHMNNGENRLWFLKN